MNKSIIAPSYRARKISSKALAPARIKNVLLNQMSALACVVCIAGIYFLAIARPRYQSTSDFLVRQPMASAMAAPSVLGLGSLLGSSAMLGSLEDGRYLAVYMHSPEVMQRVFSRLINEGLYRRRAPDPLAGLAENANRDQQLEFFRRQVQVWPQELSGVIKLTTTGLDPATALRLNELLLKEGQRVVNEMNQSISRDQLNFARQEVDRARQRLNQATDKLNSYKARYGQLDPVQESVATSNYITALEAKLVEFKVEEASLRRQFRDPKAPEVQFAVDQVQELQKQISSERQILASPKGRDLGSRATDAMKLQNDLTFATENLRAALAAVENSRMESQRQLKFVIMLSTPQAAATQSWDWRWKGIASTGGIVIGMLGIIAFVRGAKART